LAGLLRRRPEVLKKLQKLDTKTLGADRSANRRFQFSWRGRDTQRRYHGYLANDAQSEWAARARRSLKFCEMQLHISNS
jgi:hypothetical protein